MTTFDRLHALSDPRTAASESWLTRLRRALRQQRRWDRQVLDLQLGQAQRGRRS